MKEFEPLIQGRVVVGGKYRIEELLGQGGMGVVVAATHLELDERVAIKLLASAVAEVPGMRDRFINEAKATARLKGPHVTRVRDVGDHEGHAYLVMEYLVGRDLEKVVMESPLPTPVAVDYVLQACEAIAEAHVAGIVHRDIKPANLFLAEESDGSSTIKVVDFGISTGVSSGQGMRLTAEEAVLGTPAYMSPEQMRAARLADARSDIWSLGAVLYELVEGRSAFDGESYAALCVQIAIHDPNPMTAPIAPGLARAIRKCLEKDPAARWQSVAELARAIAPYTKELRLVGEQLGRIGRIERGRSPTPIPVQRKSGTGAAVEALRIAAARARVAMKPITKDVP